MDTMDRLAEVREASRRERKMSAAFNLAVERTDGDVNLTSNSRQRWHNAMARLAGQVELYLADLGTVCSGCGTVYLVDGVSCICGQVQETPG